mgnify:CR=1 FL=1
MGDGGAGKTQVTPDEINEMASAPKHRPFFKAKDPLHQVRWCCTFVCP